MTSIFQAPTYQFPYKTLSFPGQHSDETILFVTREGHIMPRIKQAVIFTIWLALTVLIFAIRTPLNSVSVGLANLTSIILLSTITLGTIFFTIWVRLLWKKSVFIITTRRLTKFIYTTPWTRYQMSLGLDKIVDTGAYQKGYFQALTGLGYFVARSSAGNIKNFKIVNISFAEDLHNYVNKLLFTFNTKTDQLDQFRPFIPHLKGKQRKEFVEKTTPEYSK